MELKKNFENVFTNMLRKLQENFEKKEISSQF